MTNFRNRAEQLLIAILLFPIQTVVGLVFYVGEKLLTSTDEDDDYYEQTAEGENQGVLNRSGP